MSEYRPVATLEDADTLDSDEVVAGYRLGLTGQPEPRNCTRSFWHGWRNGFTDGGFRPIDRDQKQLACLVTQRNAREGLS